MSITLIAAVLGAAAEGGAVGWLAQKRTGAESAHVLEEKLSRKLKAAKEKVASLREQAEAEARTMRDKTEKEMSVQRSQLLELEKRIADRESSLDKKLNVLETQESDLKAQRAEGQKQDEKLKALM